MLSYESLFGCERISNSYLGGVTFGQLAQSTVLQLSAGLVSRLHYLQGG